MKKGNIENKTITCDFCQTVYDKKEKKCPNCGAKTPRSKAPILIMIFFVLIIFATFIGNNISFSIPTEPKNVKAKNLNIENNYKTYLSQDGSSYIIEGTVKNDSSKDYDYVEIKFNAYDEMGNLIDTCVDNFGELQANSRWKFKARCLTNPGNIKKVSLKEINGK
jgi:hypothetical protein